MKDKDLVKQLNTLRDIKPRSSWVKDNREVLFSQISSGTNEAREYGFFKKLQLAFVVLPQPAIAVFLIGAVLFGSSIVSIKASRDTKPGDSLYVAKIINEKAKIALTFSEEKKARLGLEFAGNRAEELKNVLIEGSGLQKEKAADLVENYKKEISVARARIERMNQEKEIPMSTEDVLPEESKALDEVTDDESVMMFTAGTEKDEKGLQVSSAPKLIDATEVEQEDDSETQTESEVIEVAASEESAMAASSSELIASEETDDSDLIKHVENLASETEELLLNNDDINTDDLSALTDKADQITAQLDQGEVRGASSSVEVIEVEIETASSTN